MASRRAVGYGLALASAFQFQMPSNSLHLYHSSCLILAHGDAQKTQGRGDVFLVLWPGFSLFFQFWLPRTGLLVAISN